MARLLIFAEGLRRGENEFVNRIFALVERFRLLGMEVDSMNECLSKLDRSLFDLNERLEKSVSNEHDFIKYYEVISNFSHAVGYFIHVIYSELENSEDKETLNHLEWLVRMLYVTIDKFLKYDFEEYDIQIIVNSLFNDYISDTKKYTESNLFRDIELPITYKSILENAGLEYPQTLAEQDVSFKNVFISSQEDLTLNIEINQPNQVLGYKGVIELYIDSKDAAEINRFLYLVTNALSSIEGVKLELLDAKMGSFWQSIKIRIDQIKNFFAREDVQDVMKQGVEEGKDLFESGYKAARAEYIDKRVLDLEEKKVELRKKEVELEMQKNAQKGALTPEQQQRLNQIAVEKEEQKLIQEKLQSMKLALEIQESIAAALKAGYEGIDSDFSIKINDILAVEKKDGQLKPGPDIDKIADSFTESEGVEE